MAASRARACSSSSRTRMPAPSPTTNPSRSLSNGRQACSGSALRVESARIAAKPPTPMGVIAASAPPAITTSASSRSMVRNALPTECALVVHAVDVDSFGPSAPYRMLTWPAAGLAIVPGIKNGEILRGPPCSMALCSRSITSNPPMPDPIFTPTRSAFDGPIFKPEFVMASWAAASAKWMKRPILRASFFSIKSSGLKPFTSAANVTGNPVVSKLVMGAIPLLPESRLFQTSGAVLPIPHNSPMPVTTTLLAILPDSLTAFRVFLDVLGGVFYGLDFLCIFVRDLQVKGLLELHHQFDYVERVCSQILLKRRAGSHFSLIDLKLLDDDLLYLFFHCCCCHSVLLSMKA